MYDIYVPNYENGNCAYVYDANWIRVYETNPSYGQTIDYIDYNYNAHYIHRYGQTTFNNYSTLPTCNRDITSNFYHRTDIFEIVAISTIFLGWLWFLISKLVKTLLKGGRIW